MDGIGTFHQVVPNLESGCAGTDEATGELLVFGRAGKGRGRSAAVDDRAARTRERFSGQSVANWQPEFRARLSLGGSSVTSAPTRVALSALHPRRSRPRGSGTPMA